MKNTTFSVPSCQLRIVASDGSSKGLLPGSTKTWTLQKDEEGENSSRKGILMFESNDIAPRTWKLDIRDDDYPVVYIDKQIPNPGIWARNDPVFISCVLPAIIRELFEDILSDSDDPDQNWMLDWLNWADSMMPGKPRSLTDDNDKKKQWIDDLLDNFCYKHRALEMLLVNLKE